MLKRRTLVFSAIALAILISAAIPAQAESSKPTRGVPGIFVSPDGDGDVNITRRGISTTKTPDFFTNATCSGTACGYEFTCTGSTASCTDGSGGGCTVTGGGERLELTITC